GSLLLVVDDGRGLRRSTGTRAQFLERRDMMSLRPVGMGGNVRPYGDQAGIDALHTVQQGIPLQPVGDPQVQLCLQPAGDLDRLGASLGPIPERTRSPRFELMLDVEEGRREEKGGLVQVRMHGAGFRTLGFGSDSLSFARGRFPLGASNAPSLDLVL